MKHRQIVEENEMRFLTKQSNGLFNKDITNKMPNLSGSQSNVIKPGVVCKKTIKYEISFSPQFLQRREKRIQYLRQQGIKNLNQFLKDPSIIKQWDNQTLQKIININTYAQYEARNDPQRLKKVKQFRQALVQYHEQLFQRTMKQKRKQLRQLKRIIRKRNQERGFFYYLKKLFCGVKPDDQDNSLIDKEYEEEEEEDDDKQDSGFETAEQIIAKTRDKVIQVGNVTYFRKGLPRYGFIKGTNIPQSRAQWLAQAGLTEKQLAQAGF